MWRHVHDHHDAQRRVPSRYALRATPLRRLTVRQVPVEDHVGPAGEQRHQIPLDDVAPVLETGDPLALIEQRRRADHRERLAGEMRSESETPRRGLGFGQAQTGVRVVVAQSATQRCCPR